ncbi:MAG: hypothetical protein ABMA64_39950 [Myxococcota bacterium]
MVRFAVVAVVLAGCGEPEVVETPFEGPGFDAATGRLVAQDTPFVVGLTELHVKNAPGPGKAFGEHANAVGEHVYADEPAGFVGGSFRNVGKLQWWTMTVWTDEASMNDFVLSSPHANAMADLGRVSSAARSTHVTFDAGGAPPSWDWALDELEGVDWLIAP